MATPAGNGAAAQIERRRSSRYPFDSLIEIEWGSIRLKGRVIDISAEGMQIEVANPLWLGASFTAHLPLETPVQMKCVVRRISPGQSMAVTFALNEEGRTQLVVLLETLAKK
jgi:hypothetical protein